MQRADRDYWAGAHPRPLTPSQQDVETYAELMVDSTSRLLLGNTRLLMPLCTVSLDLDPFLDDPRVRVGDWTKNTENYDAIFGDGVMNFTEQLAKALLTMASQHSNVFVVRAFNHRLQTMRVADYFPSAEDFDIGPSAIVKYPEYSFYKWEFQ